MMVIGLLLMELAQEAISIQVVQPQILQVMVAIGTTVTLVNVVILMDALG